MQPKIDILADPDVEVVELNELKQKSKVRLVSANEIQKMELPPIRWIVKDFLPEGLTILAGSPKVGKSWMALNIALSVATKSKALGFFETEATDILYLALEDNFRRIQDRLNNILNNEIDKEAPSNIYFLQESFDFPKLNEGGIDELEKIVYDNPKIKFIIVDTLGRSLADKRRKDNNSYRADYELFAAMHNLTLRKNICMLLLHHTKKSEEVSVFNEISGTTGITGAMDTMMVLKKKEKLGKLYITGRDIKDNEYSVVFDENLYCWNVVEDEINTTAERKEIYELIKSYDREMKTGEITEILGKTKPNVSKLLGKMLKGGLLESNKTGYYKIKEEKSKDKLKLSKTNLFN